MHRPQGKQRLLEELVTEGVPGQKPRTQDGDVEVRGEGEKKMEGQGSVACVPDKLLCYSQR